MRKELVGELLRDDRLPTPPAVALEVIRSTADPDCKVTEVVTRIELDPSLSAKILQAANSSVYGLRQPVSSVARATTILGLKAVRGLVLGVTLPALVGRQRPDPFLDQLWMRSVAGAVLARELAIREGRQGDDDFTAALLRDLGLAVMRRHYGAAWDTHLVRHTGRLLTDPCEAERESFGIDHADVCAELLARWNLSADLTEPIRFHHHLGGLAGKNRVQSQRGELLWLADQLAHLDEISQHPHLLAPMLEAARDRFGMTLDEVIAFVEWCDPNIEAFTALLQLGGNGLRNVGPTVAAAVAALVALRADADANVGSSTVA